MTRIGFLGLPGGSIPNSFCNDTDYLMAQAGLNTGNVAFWLGFSRILGAQLFQVGWGSKPEDISDKFDVLVIAAANFLKTSYDLSVLRDLVEGLDKPVIISGLGAQADKEEDMPKLTEGTLGFLKAVASRCDNLGVRGAYSKTVCAHYGVENTIDLGCPSLLINANQNLGERISSRWNAPLTNFTSASASIQENLQIAESKLFTTVDYLNGKYVLQNPAALLKVIRHEQLSDKEKSYNESFREFINPGMSTGQFNDFLRKKAVYFTSAHAWLDYLTGFSHAVGTRIHGSILPLMAGVPSICITHDTRTRELCETLCVPAMPCEDFANFDQPINELFDCIGFDEQQFRARRSELAGYYKTMFEGVGIPTSTHLNRFL